LRIPIQFAVEHFIRFLYHGTAAEGWHGGVSIRLIRCLKSPAAAAPAPTANTR
jgi:hypothetical protein